MSEILDALLSRVPDTWDKSEGSYIYDVLAPVAAELDALANKIASISDNRYIDTATGEYLDRCVYEYGISRKEGVYATGTVTLTGTAGTPVSSGALVATETAQYMTTESVTIGNGGTVSVGIICTQSGTVGNAAIGAVNRLPVTLYGVTAITNTAAITGGVNRETDDELRERVLLKIRAPSASGNVDNYIVWAKEVSGVGEAVVVPLWNGNGTVKVIISASGGTSASSSLVSEVSSHIDTVRPIGAAVTVVSATAVTISVSAALTTISGYNVSSVVSDVSAAIERYIKSVGISGTVLYSKVGAIILSVDGVADYSALTVNNAAANVSVGNGAIATFGGFTNATN